MPHVPMLTMNNIVNPKSQKIAPIMPIISALAPQNSHDPCSRHLVITADISGRHTVLPQLRNLISMEYDAADRPFALVVWASEGSENPILFGPGRNRPAGPGDHRPQFRFR